MLYIHTYYTYIHTVNCYLFLAYNILPYNTQCDILRPLSAALKPECEDSPLWRTRYEMYVCDVPIGLWDMQSKNSCACNQLSVNYKQCDNHIRPQWCSGMSRQSSLRSAAFFSLSHSPFSFPFQDCDIPWIISVSKQVLSL